MEIPIKKSILGLVLSIFCALVCAAMTIFIVYIMIKEIRINSSINSSAEMVAFIILLLIFIYFIFMMIVAAINMFRSFFIKINDEGIEQPFSNGKITPWKEIVDVKVFRHTITLYTWNDKITIYGNIFQMKETLEIIKKMWPSRPN